jgi:lipopolysaccharide export system protein LptA
MKPPLLPPRRAGFGGLVASSALTGLVALFVAFGVGGSSLSAQTSTTETGAATTGGAGTGGTIDPGAKGSPVEIESEQGIEWRRNDKVYIARGNAKAKRGDSQVFADTLTARYRDRANGSSEIWQLEADGQVRLTSPGRTVYGEKAVYNLDTRVLRMTGNNLRVVTTEETVTAEDSLEYHEGSQTILAHGNAVAVRGDRRVRADVLTGHLEKRTDGSYEITRLEADGNVEVKTKDTYAKSAKGDYDLNKDFITLTGDVKITNGQNQFNGEYAEMDVNTGVSRLLGSPGGTGKVKSLIMPSSGQ